MYTKFVTVKELMSKLNYEQITGDENSLNRKISVPDPNRPGLELTGYYQYSQRKRIAILGIKEMGYLSEMAFEDLVRSFDFITHEKTPCIVITKNLECPKILMEIASQKNFPILKTKEPTYRAIVDIVSYLDEELAESTSIHGGLMQIYGKGVLITGECGMGKSEIALELIKKGHLLVADDRVDCSLIHKNIIGSSPDVIKGMLELRGVGVINIAKMFGVASVLDKTQIDLIIHLEPWSKEKEYDRIGLEEKKYQNILGIDLPKLVIPVREGRSMAVIIESAVTNFLLASIGQSGDEEIENRVLNLIEKNYAGGR